MTNKKLRWIMQMYAKESNQTSEKYMPGALCIYSPPKSLDNEALPPHTRHDEFLQHLHCANTLRHEACRALPATLEASPSGAAGSAGTGLPSGAFRE